jgi:signal transduction histidine kinase
MAVISVHSQDISTVDELNATAREILKSKGKEGIDEARNTVLRSLQMAIELNYAKGEIDAYYIMAESYEIEENPQLALRFIKKAKKRAAKPDSSSTVVIMTKPSTIEEFAEAQVVSGSKKKSKSSTEEEQLTETLPQSSRSSETSRKTHPLVLPVPTKPKTSGNTDNDIKIKQSELEEYKRKIEELQSQNQQEGDSLSAIRNAEIARLIAEREKTLSQIEALQKEKENNQLRLQQQRTVLFFLISIVLVMLLFIFLVIRQIRAKNKANAKLAKALEELKATQAQLVQQEKLASLGQLTAGIAHEIQNPLNFVNNFADLSLELLEELKEAKTAQEMKDIADDLSKNLSKIHHHGKRADNIVKNMLQHSREGKGEKEPTDINELAKEFVNLAYHGMRAQNKDFNCKINLLLDSSIPAIKIVKQDMGRVLLNMFNNSFYSLSKKISLNIQDFIPTLTVTTQQKDHKVSITIQDNGLGMSEEVKQKLFNPFFTTKPTGEGTGLGLSISHDIIVKIHQGNIQVESQEGEFAIFKITLPLS